MKNLSLVKTSLHAFELYKIFYADSKTIKIALWLVQNLSSSWLYIENINNNLQKYSDGFFFSWNASVCNVTFIID